MRQIFIRNDAGFEDDMPELYKENPRAPITYFSDLNRMLAATFFEEKREAVWHYKDR